MTKKKYYFIRNSTQKELLGNKHKNKIFIRYR